MAANLLRRGLWAGVALVLWAGPVAAQTTCKGTPQSPIRLSAVQLRTCITALTWIEDATLQGPDLIAAIESISRNGGEAHGEVRIRQSTIQRGLYFSKGTTKVSELAAPPLKELAKRFSYPLNDTVQVVKIPITLENTRVQAGAEFDSGDNDSMAIQARDVIFARGINITGRSVIEGSASFARAAFVGRSLFDGTHFMGTATFEDAGFDDGASFGNAHFDGTAAFGFTRFDGKADFPHATFTQESSFEKARFCEPVDFEDAEFNANARFPGAQLASDAVFRRARFLSGADFASAHVAGEMTLAMARMQGVITFSNAHVHTLRIGSTGQRSRIEGELYFGDARIAAASLRAVRLDGSTNFARAQIGPEGFETDVYKFNPESRMRRSAARSGCGAEHPTKSSGLRRQSSQPSPATPSATAAISLREVDFYDRVTFQDSRIQSPTEFDSVTFRQGANLLGVRFVVNPDAADRPAFPLAGLPFQSLDMEWKSVAEFMALDSRQPGAPESTHLEQIEARFKAQGQLAEALDVRRAARWAQVREARACLWMRLTGAAPGDDQRCAEGPGFGETLGRVAVFPIWGLESGFSTSLWRLLAVIVFVYLGFAWLYYKAARMLKRIAPVEEGAQGMRLHPLATPFTFAPSAFEGRWIRMRGLGTALKLSALVLLRFGRSDLAIDGSVRGVSLRYLVALQWALGIPLLIDLVYTLSETQPFLQRLLTGTIG